MTTLNYTLKLISDAMPSSGFGTELIDSMITRDINGTPIIRASHLKGVMRQTLIDTISLLGHVKSPLVKNVFGSTPKEEIDCGALFSLSDAVLTNDGSVMIVTRTKINNHGVAESGSLRSSEMVANGSEFLGKCYIDAEAGAVEELAVRFALIALDAIGGSRTRGVGQCVVSIDGYDKTPGILLKELDILLKGGIQQRKFNKDIVESNFKNQSTQLFRIEFEAETPVCCPEIPVKTNLLTSGFSIPASAVQGAILHRLNRQFPEVASACFVSDKFRVWPLQPLPRGATESVRVSLTHKVNKNAEANKLQSENIWFDDEAIHIDWREHAKGAPLKSNDGVLIQTKAGLALWKSSAMPRVISIHNSVKEKDLFSIESMAPGRWVGFVALPVEAADVFEKVVQENSRFVFGKRRSVQGGGILSLGRIENLPVPEVSDIDETILITQSPVLIDYKPDVPLETSFKKIACTWATKNGLPEPEMVWADAGIRFGWNRHHLGKTIGKQNRLQALPVVLPGAVIKFACKVETVALQKAMIAGLGDCKQRGFGALLCHPGVAKLIHKDDRELREVSSASKFAMLKAVEIAKTKESLPSSSQISAIISHLKNGGALAAREYLSQQKKRGDKFWSDWQEVYKDICALIDVEGAEAALEYLSNTSLARRKDEA